MKKSIIFLSIFLNCWSFSQIINNARDFDNFISLFGNKVLNIDEINGTPYVDKSFSTAIVSPNFKPIEARYNNYSDEIEFYNNDDEKIYIVPNESKFHKIEFVKRKIKLLYLSDFGKELSGYFQELNVKGNVKLYKKTTIDLILPVKATTSYELDRPASFSKPKTSYYFLIDETLKEVPKNTKSISDIFNTNNKTLINYIKKNKIKLDNENDLNNLVDFLNSVEVK